MSFVTRAVNFYSLTPSIIQPRSPYLTRLLTDGNQNIELDFSVFRMQKGAFGTG